MLMRVNDLKYFTNFRNFRSLLKKLFTEEDIARINTEKLVGMGHGLGGAAMIQLSNETDAITAVISLNPSLAPFKFGV